MALSPIVQQAILSQRAPDFLGSFEAGQEQSRQAEARQRQQQSQQLTGQILGQQFAPGSQLAELAGVDPARALELSEAVGIPISEPRRLKNFAQNVQAARQIASTDERGAVRFVLQEKNRLNTQGVPTPRMDEFLLDFQQDPQGALEALDQLGQAFEAGGLVPVSPLTLAREKREAELGKTEKELKATEQKQVNALRKDVKDISKSFRLVEESFNRVERVGRKATPASDISLIFNFMKMNDPGSTVREGEFATAQNATGVPDRAINLYNNLLRGTRLSPDQRDDFISQAQGLFEAQRQATDNQVGNILEQADQDQIPRVRVLGKKRLSEFEQRATVEGIQQPTVAQPTQSVSLEALTAQDLSNLTDEQLQQLAGGQ